MNDATFRATVGERAFDLVFRDGQLFIDEEPVSYVFEPSGDGSYTLLVEGQSFPVVIEEEREGLRVTVAGRPLMTHVKDERALLLERFGLEDADAAAEREIRAPMPGLVLRVMVEVGQHVEPREGLLVLEAMKMENEIRALAAGTVKAIYVEPGEAVVKNQLLMEMETV